MNSYEIAKYIIPFLFGMYLASQTEMPLRWKVRVGLLAAVILAVFTTILESLWPIK